jgi:DNA polymerase III delta prime subunit
MAFEPQKITKEHILQAIAKIENENIQLTPSTGYDLIVNNKRYPPKEVMRYAHEFANGEFRWNYGGGPPTNKYFIALGFKIEEKNSFVQSNNEFEKIIERYKEILTKEGLTEEAYKWQLTKELASKPDLNADNLTEEFKHTYYKNLVFPQFYSVQKFLSINATEAYRILYEELFNEQTALQDRVIAFIDNTLKLYRATPNNAHGTHHDERSIATILAVKYPDKYALYKASFYAELCKTLGVQKAKVKYRYVHYLKMLDDFKENYLSNEIELIENVNGLLTAEGKPFYKDNSLNILAQDILYRVLDPSKNDVTFFKIVEQFFESLEDEESVLANFKKGTAEKYKGKDIFVWLVDHLNCIGDTEAHYEIREEKGNVYIDLHFEAKKKEDVIKYENLTTELPENIKAIDWWDFKSLRYEQKKDGIVQEIKLNDEDVIDKIKDALLYFEETIADKVRAIKRNKTEKLIQTMKQPLNQILYGPPGTGKTYNSINKALEIINEEEEQNLDRNDRKAVKYLFDKRVEEGRIAFTTFHQSMSYEDFIEGIKPNLDEENTNSLDYTIEPGIFKQICINAREIVIGNTNIDWDSVSFYKMSLGGKMKPEVHSWCIENNKISLGYGGDKDLKAYSSIKDWNQYRDKFKDEFSEIVNDTRFNIQSAFAFQNMRKGDIVVISKGNHFIDAIGVVKSDYYWDDSTPIGYFHFRNVEWIVKDMNMSPERFLKKKISMMTIYELDKNELKLDAFKDLTKNQNSSLIAKKPYVLIIDEINRGNVSKIFGELITLIEESKRVGKSEALKAILPYSKDIFSVPDNVYIVGTMNTADRSVEALDTALRRRFEFVEMMPNYSLFEGRPEYDYNGVNVSTLLTTINNRIEVLLGRDHQIGHSFFILNKDESGNYTETIEERVYNAFIKNIIPLLQEYFYGDYNKMGLVLGSGFVHKEKVVGANSLFANSQEFNGHEYVGNDNTFSITNFIIDNGSVDYVTFSKAIENLLNKSKVESTNE